MAKYLFVYHGGGPPSNPEDGQKVMAAWGAWFAGMGVAVVDGGAPVGKSTTVRSDGSVAGDGGSNPASGYSLIETASLEAAQAYARGCPHLASGGSVEIAPIMEM